ncbi:hypothetical protein V8F06_007602 [Rhypophila decipiens]
MTDISQQHFEAILIVSRVIADPHPMPSTTKARSSSIQRLRNNSMAWTPVLLQRGALYAYSACFSSLAIALESIFIISKHRQGLFTTTFSDNHFEWTYTPPVVLTIVSALWTCVDFQDKVATRALRNRDMLVAATSTISLLPSVMLAFAPSLVGLATFEINTLVTLLKEFVDDPTKLTGPGILPLYGAIGLKRYRMDYPLGIYGNLAFPPFTPSPSHTTQLEVTLDAIMLDLIEITEGDYGDKTTITFSLSSKSCRHTTISEPFSFPRSINNRTYDVGLGRYVYNSSDILVGGVISGQCDDGSLDWDNRRLIWLFAEFTLKFPVWGAVIERLDTSQTLVCKPLYRMVKAVVQQGSGTSYVVSLANDTSSRKLGGIHAWDIATLMVNAYKESMTYNGQQSISCADLKSEFCSTKTSFDQMSLAMLGLDNTSYPDLQAVFNYTSLRQSFAECFQVHGSFLVTESIMESITKPAQGHSKTSQTRLFVHDAASQLMAAICLLSASILIAVSLTLPSKTRPLEGDPRTISGLLSLFSGSETVSGLQKPLKRKLDVEFEDRILNGSFFQQSPLKIATNLAYPKPRQDYLWQTTTIKHNRRSRRGDADASQLTMHCPLLLRPYSRYVSSALVCGIIVLLEALLRVSQHQDGIGAALPGIYVHYLWTLLPTLTMGLIPLFYSAVDFELRTITPYSSLNQGPVTIASSLALNLRGILAPHSVYKGLRQKTYATVAGTITAILAGLLTISSGSIFFEKMSSWESSQSLRLAGTFSDVIQQDDYNIAHGVGGNSSGSEKFGIISTLILHSNLSYPEGTYENLAFPRFSLDEVGITDSKPSANYSDVKVQVIVPALRGNLSCKILPRRIISTTIHLNTTDMNKGVIRMNITECPTFGCPYSQELFNWIVPSSSKALPLDISAPSNGIFAWHHDDTLTFGGLIEYLFIWGNFSTTAIQNRNASAVSISGALACNASIEALDVETTFYGRHALKIRPDDPPVQLEERVRSIVRPHGHLQKLGGLYQNLRAPLSADGSLLDPFFSILTTTQHEHALPLSALSDPRQVDRVVASIKKHHGIITAQALSATSRIEIDHSINITIPGQDNGVFARVGMGLLNSTIPAKVINLKGVLRIFQDEKSTRVVQALLAMTLTLSFLSWYHSPRNDILPNPPSIPASVRTLLVGGNLYTERFGPNKKTVVEMTRAVIEDTFGNKPAFWMGWGRTGVSKHRRNRDASVYG